MRRFLFAAALLAAAGAAACGGYDSPSAPGPSTAPAGAIIIDVVAINGSQSFSPNPATIPAGQTIAWHNIDTTTHRVVLNDGKLDTGNIAPGKFSAPMTLAASGPYHCSIHPEMVGTLATAQ